MTADRISRQIAFLLEADKLKSILRRTPLVDRSRQENSAEHSWHLLLAALVFREHLTERCDLLRALEMLIVHDLVEVDAGDTFAYGAVGHATKAARERAAADRMFGMLPEDQAVRLRALWEEFEAQQTVESRFANALDRIQPLLQNAASGGGSWLTHDVTRAQVMTRTQPIRSTLPPLWPRVEAIVEEFTARGIILDTRNTKDTKDTKERR